MAENSSTIKTTVILDTNQAQQQIVKLGSVASDSTRTLNERITAKNKQVKLQNQLSKKTVSDLTKEVKHLKKIGASEKDVTKALTKLNRERLKATKLTATNTKQLNKLNQTLKTNRTRVKSSSSAFGGLSSRFTKGALVASAYIAVIAGIARAFRDTMRRIREFDKTMTSLAAILGVSRKDVKDLQFVITTVAGASIRTSSEVAKLAETLVTLGKSKSEVIKLLKPTNDLSIALQASSADAGELLIQTLNAFGEGTSAATKYADIIAKMRTSTALDFERIKISLGFLAPVSKAVGLTMENTGAILGTLVDSGIKASRAGRLLSSSFIKLGAKGITLNEALDLIDGSQDKLQTSSKLFGKQAAALGLILADNRDKTAELTEEFENAAGSLEDLTTKQLASLDAKLKILDSSWEKFVLGVESGDGALSKFFRNIVVGTTEMIDFLSILNEDFGTENFRKLNEATAGGVKHQEALLKSRQELNETLIGEDGTGMGLDIEALGLEDLGNVQDKLNDARDVMKTYNEILKKKQAGDESGAASIEETEQAIISLNQTIGRLAGQEQVLQSTLNIESKEDREARIAAEENAKEAEYERKQEKSKKQVVKEAEQRKKDLEWIAKEEQNVLNEIELAKAETAREKAEIASFQERDKKLKDLEGLAVSENEKATLIEGIHDAHILRLREISAKERETKKEKDAENLEADIEAQFELDELDIEARRKRGEDVEALELGLLERKLAHELSMEGLTANQKLLLTAQYLKDKEKLTDKTNKNLFKSDKAALKALESMAADAFGIAQEVAIAKMIMAAPESIGNVWSQAAKQPTIPQVILHGVAGSALVLAPIIKGLADIKKARFSGGKGKRSGAGGSISSSVGGGASAIPTSVGQSAITDVGANNAARLGVDPSLSPTSSAIASNNVLGGTGSQIVFSEAKYNEFQSQVSFKEEKTTIG